MSFARMMQYQPMGLIGGDLIAQSAAMSTEILAPLYSIVRNQFLTMRLLSTWIGLRLNALRPSLLPLAIPLLADGLKQ